MTHLQPSGKLFIRLLVIGALITTTLLLSGFRFSNDEPAHLTSSPELGEILTIWSDGKTNEDHSIAYNSLHDEYLVVWQCLPPTSDICARRVHTDGSMEPMFTLGVNGWDPDVAFSPEYDKYLIAYSNEGDIWANLVSWDGSFISDPIVIDNGTLEQRHANVVNNSHDCEFLVVNRPEYRGGLGGVWEIYAQRVRASDGLLLNNIEVANGTWGFMSWSGGAFDAAYNPTQNEYLVVYDRWYQGADIGHIYGKILSSDLGTIGEEQTLTDEATSQLDPSIIVGSNQYMVSFYHDTGGYALRLTGSGDPSEPLTGIYIGPTGSNDVGYGLEYGYLFVWSNDVDIFGRYLLPGRDNAEDEPFTILDLANEQRTPEVACAPSGDCLVVDQNYISVDESDIMGRLVIAPEPIFQDVFPTHWAYDYIEAIYNAGITYGYPDGTYRPDNPVARSEIAVFLERGMRGSGYSPPTTIRTIFDDVPVSHWAAAWIEQLAADGITGGCSTNPPMYCPERTVTRAQMAIFLERAMHWPAPYTPPPASGTVFDDVPVGHWAAAWIEQLAADGITGGCSTSLPLYCPDNPVTRAQMAVFLVRTFNLPIP